MGIYDRDYYRKEGPSYLDMLVPSGAVCKWLIIVNLLVFFVQLLASPRFTFALGLIIPDVYGGEVWRLLTYAFLHDTGNLWHIAFNMLFLWWFGSELEERYGSAEFLSFYLLCAIAGACGYLVQGAFNDDTYYRSICIGASGAVTGVMVLYAFHFPRRTILVMLLIPVPIWFFVVFGIVKDLAGLFGPSEVAVSVHLGGAAFALAYYQTGMRLTRLGGGVKHWWKQRSKPRLRIYRPEETKEAVPVGAHGHEVDEHLEAKVDAVLEKVQRSGQESLTDKERQILMRASEIYRKKRT